MWIINMFRINRSKKQNYQETKKEIIMTFYKKMMNGSLHDITIYWGIPWQRTVHGCRRRLRNFIEELFISRHTETTSVSGSPLPHMTRGWESIWYHCILLMLFFSSLDICFWHFQNRVRTRWTLIGTQHRCAYVTRNKNKSVLCQILLVSS